MHFYSRSRDELWHKGDSSGNVQLCARFATTATATLGRSGGAGRARLPHGEAFVLLPRPEPTADPDVELRRGWRARARRPRGAAITRAHAGRPPRAAGPRAPTRSSSWTIPRASARRSARRRTRSPGRRGGVGRAAGARRRPTCSTTCRCCCFARRPDRRGAGDAQWPSPLNAPPELASEPGARSRARRQRQRDPDRGCRFVDDCETPVSAFLKLRDGRPLLPARVGRAGPAGPLLVPRLQAPGDPAVTDGELGEWRGSRPRRRARARLEVDDPYAR